MLRDWIMVVALAGLCTAPACKCKPDGAGAKANKGPVTKTEKVEFKSGANTLKGFIAKPPGQGPFPAIVYNHGIEKAPSTSPEYLAFFVSKGYVVFLPHRRGHGKSMGQWVKDRVSEAPAADRHKALVDEMVAQNDDVTAAYEATKNLPYVDPNRIVVAGCSYGGLQALLSAEKQVGFKAALDWGGGADVWGSNPVLRDWMSEAAGKVTIPIFLLQAENDYSTGPNTVLGPLLEKAGKVHQMKIYPPNGSGRKEGHGGFCSRGKAKWGDDVMAFLDKYNPSGGAAASPSGSASAGPVVAASASGAPSASAAPAASASANAAPAASASAAPKH